MKNSKIKGIVAESFKKVKEWGRAYASDLFVAAIIFLVGLGSFGLGRLSILWPQKEPITILPPAAAVVGSTAAGSEQPALASPGAYVGSRSGTAYHLPSCPGAQKIKEENKIWFQTKEDAEKRGYHPAANCPGL